MIIIVIGVILVIIGNIINPTACLIVSELHEEEISLELLFIVLVQLARIDEINNYRREHEQE